MIYKSVLAILFLMLIACLRRSSSMSLRMANVCQGHTDCGRFSICGENGKCRAIKSLSDLDKRKIVECPVFKSPCSSDEDCPCKLKSMVCEANECVVRAQVNLSSNFKKK